MNLSCSVCRRSPSYDNSIKVRSSCVQYEHVLQLGSATCKQYGRFLQSRQSGQSYYLISLIHHPYDTQVK